MNHLTKKIFFSNFIACLISIVAVAQNPCDSLTTLMAGGNGWNGNMFDVTAVQPVTITGFDCHFETTVVSTFSVQIYYKAGTFVGSQAVAGDWTLAGIVVVSSSGAGNLTHLPITLNIQVPAGQTYAFYITVTNLGINMNFTDGTLIGSVYSSNSKIQVKEGLSLQYKFGSTNGTPKKWNGKIRYCDSPTGMKDISLKNEFDIQVFPNPFSEYAMVKVNSTSNKNVDLTLYDMFGNVVKMIPGNNSGTIKLEKDNLPSGICFYQVNQGDVKKTGKIIVQ